MLKKMRLRVIAAVAAALLACFAAACSSDAQSVEGSAGDGSDGNVHTIAVAVYNVTDPEVVMFRQYLEEYIAGSCFEDVEFVYSESLDTADEVLEFIADAAASGAEGVMSFYTIDLEAEVAACEDAGMYYLVASGTVSDEDFAAVEDNEFFLGAFGPGSDTEYEAGYDMGAYFADADEGDSYLILSGGAYLGNEMHLLRTEGMLEALADRYGVEFDRSISELAASSETVTLTAGGLNVTICPGYVSSEDGAAAAAEAIEASGCDCVLSVAGVGGLSDELGASGAVVGAVDCYSQDNLLLFDSGTLSYLTGKYGSIVGPSFAAMYNAVTGHAGDFREDDGTAFNVYQGFWTSDSAADYEEKYAFASNVTVNAYNYEDLYRVCVEYNGEASLESLKALAGAYTFEDAQERRNG